MEIGRMLDGDLCQMLREGIKGLDQILNRRANPETVTQLGRSFLFCA